MEDIRIERIKKSVCATCGVKYDDHKSSYNYKTGITSDFTHAYDTGTPEEIVFVARLRDNQ